MCHFKSRRRHEVPTSMLTTRESIRFDLFYLLFSLLQNRDQLLDCEFFSKVSSVVHLHNKSSLCINGVSRIFRPLGKVLANEFWELGNDGQRKKSLGHNA